MKKAITITSLFVLAMILMQAFMVQQELQLNVSYNTAMTLGASFPDYVNKTSFRGVQGSALYGIDNHFRIGLQAPYNQKYGRQANTVANRSDILRVLGNRLESGPPLGKKKYAFLTKALLIPYTGPGDGIHFGYYYQYMGELEYSNLYAKARFTRDAGLSAPFRSNIRYGLRLRTFHDLWH